MISSEPAVEWAPFDYLPVPLSLGTKTKHVNRPAVLVRVRRQDHDLWADASSKVQLHGIIDPGADASVVPL